MYEQWIASGRAPTARDSVQTGCAWRVPLACPQRRQGNRALRPSTEQRLPALDGVRTKMQDYGLQETRGSPPGLGRRMPPAPPLSLPPPGPPRATRASKLPAAWRGRGASSWGAAAAESARARALGCTHSAATDNSPSGDALARGPSVLPVLGLSSLLGALTKSRTSRVCVRFRSTCLSVRSACLSTWRGQLRSDRPSSTSVAWFLARSA